MLHQSKRRESLVIFCVFSVSLYTSYDHHYDESILSFCQLLFVSMRNEGNLTTRSAGQYRPMQDYVKKDTRNKSNARELVSLDNTVFLILHDLFYWTTQARRGQDWAYCPPSSAQRFIDSSQHSCSLKRSMNECLK